MTTQTQTSHIPAHRRSQTAQSPETACFAVRYPLPALYTCRESSTNRPLTRKTNPIPKTPKSSQIIVSQRLTPISRPTTREKTNPIYRGEAHQRSRNKPNLVAAYPQPKSRQSRDPDSSGPDPTPPVRLAKLPKTPFFLDFSPPLCYLLGNPMKACLPSSSLI